MFYDIKNKSHSCNILVRNYNSASEKLFFKHRMRTFQGTFHANPDYALWYGWSAMNLDLTEIKTMAEELK